ncbi:MAG TPA: MFS transporter [Candidatus Cybelea sp.]|jgi:SHS family lactate transporter-like MFS transporter|nr:MFS transporter [Candidatus Cybelea sp.]
MTPAARKTVVAAFLGWTLDAFDYFLLTFVIVRIAGTFDKTVPEVTVAITLTLACRPIGAFVFGWLADRFGRRTPLMWDIAFYSVVELLTAFSPNFTVFLVLRALYGVAMGGEWGLGSAMAMESLPPQRRGFFSGLLQQGYMVGFLLAALAYFAVFHFTHWDWRGLFVIGVLPAGLILFIRSSVPESAVWLAGRSQRRAAQRNAQLAALRAHWPLVLYAIVFMAAMNGFSHGTQDIYPTFLEKTHGFTHGQVTTLSVLAALGAIAGGIFFGALSQRLGRRTAVMIGAVLAVAVIPLWALSPSLTLLALGAIAMQFAVQGAWGAIPAHLNELSPPDVRATFPGFTYQLGNLIAAGTLQIEATLAKSRGYPAAMSLVVGLIAVAVVATAALGHLVRPENRAAPLS